MTVSDDYQHPTNTPIPTNTPDPTDDPIESGATGHDFPPPNDSPASSAPRLRAPPPEVLEEIFTYLAPIQRFRLAVQFRFHRLRNKTIPLLKQATPDRASERGQTALLDWWRSQRLLQMEWSEFATNSAGGNGHIAWWKQSGLQMKWSEFAMDWASRRGHVEVFQWWRDRGLEMRWSPTAVDYASTNEHTDVLQWWIDSGLEMKWSEKAMDTASMNGHVAVLQWWKESGLELKWSLDATTWACQKGHVTRSAMVEGKQFGD
ncbi:hypothetical protein HK104_008840 [Borealophlyctis nickersoniae]|nr:hypothetical protein HK104_008840 [Borealophlyctis nickersoniae]